MGWAHERAEGRVCEKRWRREEEKKEKEEERERWVREGWMDKNGRLPSPCGSVLRGVGCLKTGTYNIL
jgi:hypothetical protein